MLGNPIELKWNRVDLETLKSVVDTYCRAFHVAVQAGACFGVFPRYLSKRFGRVYTFEPSPELFPIMVANVPQQNVVKLQAALGGTRGRWLQTKCELPAGKTVLHEGMTRTEPGGLVPTMLLDDLGLDACDLIYLDVEGDEPYALGGAVETIQRHRPPVVVEVNRALARHGFERKDIDKYFLAMDYRAVAVMRSDVVYLPKEFV